MSEARRAERRLGADLRRVCVIGSLRSSLSNGRRVFWLVSRRIWIYYRTLMEFSSDGARLWFALMEQQTSSFLCLTFQL